MRIAPAVAALVLIVPFAFASEVREAVSELRRTEGSPQHEIRGTCDIAEGGEFQRFRLTIDGANEAARLVVLLGDGHDGLLQIGELEAGFSHRVLLRTTQGGGQLPLGVDLVSALAERRIVVRDGDARQVLQGNVPVFAGHEEPPPPPVAPAIAREYMHRTDAAGDRESRGVIVVQRTEHESSLRFEVGRLAPETGYLAYIESGEVRELIDDFRTNGDGGAGLGRENDGLPLGADDVSELAGKRIEIENREGQVVLYGEVPAFEREEGGDDGEHGDVRERTDVHDGDSGVDVRIEVVIRERKGHEDMRCVMNDLPREDRDDDRDDGDGGGDDGGEHGDDGGDDGGGDDGAGGDDEPRGDDRPAKPGRVRRHPRGDAQIWLENDTGTLEQVAVVPIRRRGRAVWRYLAKRGDALPFGATSLRTLSGRDFEIHVGARTVASGTLPQF